jgi:hypothetical protein
MPPRLYPSPNKVKEGTAMAIAQTRPADFPGWSGWSGGRVSPRRPGVRLSGPLGPFAAAILLAALLVPNCCLTGSHGHAGDTGGFGPICFSRGVAPY